MFRKLFFRKLFLLGEIIDFCRFPTTKSGMRILIQLVNLTHNLLQLYLLFHLGETVNIHLILLVQERVGMRPWRKAFGDWYVHKYLQTNPRKTKTGICWWGRGMGKLRRAGYLNVFLGCNSFILQVSLLRVEGRWQRENVLTNGVKWDSNLSMKSHWKKTYSPH